MLPLYSMHMDRCNFKLKPGTYIVAVSGGVDSMVLLELLCRQFHTTDHTFIVAHFDHGIRDDSASDAEFVAAAAHEKNLSFVSERAELGKGASENVARIARYAFLRRIKKIYNAQAIMTAHHKDDLLETIVMNLRRGSGRRGLAPMRSIDDVMRPMLHCTKQELLDIAAEAGLQWRQDSTNSDMSYKRNAVRLKLASADPSILDQLYDLHLRAVQRNSEIDQLVRDVALWAAPQHSIIRARFVVLPYSVQSELIHYLFIQHNLPDVSRSMVERSVMAVKTAGIGKRVDLAAGYYIKVSKSVVEILQK